MPAPRMHSCCAQRKQFVLGNLCLQCVVMRIYHACLPCSNRTVDFDATTFTENTRACYPINFIDNARIPCIGPHPK
jgi:hypothetical protein